MEKIDTVIPTKQETLRDIKKEYYMIRASVRQNILDMPKYLLKNNTKTNQLFSLDDQLEIFDYNHKALKNIRNRLINIKERESMLMQAIIRMLLEEVEAFINLMPKQVKLFDTLRKAPILPKHAPPSLREFYRQKSKSNVSNSSSTYSNRSTESSSVTSIGSRESSYETEKQNSKKLSFTAKFKKRFSLTKRPSEVQKENSKQSRLIDEFRSKLNSTQPTL